MKDYRDVIIRPIITEATMKMMAEDNKVTFEVVKGVSKIEIAKAVEAAFIKCRSCKSKFNELQTKNKTCRSLCWKNKRCTQSYCKN